MAALAGNLLQGAHSLSRQLQGLVTALRSAAGGLGEGLFFLFWLLAVERGRGALASSHLLVLQLEVWCC
jgi:hypothetical protein